MPNVLSDHEIERYKRDGFLAPIDGVTSAQAASVLSRLETMERTHASELTGAGRNNPHLVLRCFDELVHDPHILDVVEDLLGPDLLVCGTVLFAKEPHSDGYVSWHQDARYMGLEPSEGLTVWIALTESTRDNGCVSMIPGSHRTGVHAHVDTFAQDNILTRGQRVVEVDDSEAVDMVLQPGQMSIHHMRTIHGSQPNTSGDRRVGLAIQSYVTPAMRQTLGHTYVQVARGEDQLQHFPHITRPSGDFVAADCESRTRVNQAWRDILYHESAERRNY